MADAVNTNVLYSGQAIYVVRFTNLSDGTGETNVIKVDRSTLTGPAGVEPTNLIIQEMAWNIQGFTSVKIAWDHNTDDTAALLSGNGYRNYDGTNGLVDPLSAGGTGDILFTTAGTTSGNTYDITLVLRLQAP